MLKFFRNIRQKLLEAGKIKSYFFYAAGEILLVMVGILLALQVNNWNEERKNRVEEINLLKGIQKGFFQDIMQMDTLQTELSDQLSYFSKIDTSFYLKIPPIYRTPIKDTTLNYWRLFRRPESFKSNSGTYDSMISSGQKNLIENRDLFLQIQRFYKYDRGLLSYYETVKTREESLAWNRAYELRYEPYKNMYEIKDKQFLAELNYYYRSINYYATILMSLKLKIKDLLYDLGLEIERLEK